MASIFKNLIYFLLFFQFSTVFVASQSNIDYRVLLLGDWGVPKDESKHKKYVIESISRFHTQQPYDIAFELGDNFYPLGITSKTRNRLKDEFEIEFPEYIFNISFYIVLGNHDYYGDINIEIDYMNHSRRWNIPNRYYSFVKKIPGSEFEMKFIITDTEPFAQEAALKMLGITDNKQLEWIRNELEISSIYKYVFIMGHHPVLSGGPHTLEKVLKINISELSNRYNVTACIAGHNHNLQHFLPKEGRNIYHSIISGSASKIKSGNSEDSDFFFFKDGGFADLDINRNNATVNYYDAKGELLYTTLILPRF